MIRFTEAERQKLAEARAIKRKAREPAPKTKIVLPRRPKLTDAQRIRVHAAYDGLCYVCGSEVPIKGPEVQYDHIRERALEGADTDANLAPICTTPCHARKSAAFLTALAHVERMRGKNDGSIKPKGTIQSRGFDNRHVPFPSSRRGWAEAK